MSGTDALFAEIKLANDKFMDRFGAGDMDGLSALYTEDCKMMPTGADVMIGRDSVKKVFGGARQAGVSTIKLEIDEVGPLGDGMMIYESSHYTMCKDNKEVFDAGKYVVIWRKVDGHWFLYTDIFNSNKST